MESCSLLVLVEPMDIFVSLLHCCWLCFLPRFECLLLYVFFIFYFCFAVWSSGLPIVPWKIGRTYRIVYLESSCFISLLLHSVSWIQNPSTWKEVDGGCLWHKFKLLSTSLVGNESGLFFSLCYLVPHIITICSLLCSWFKLDSQMNSDKDDSSRSVHGVCVFKWQNFSVAEHNWVYYIHNEGKQQDLNFFSVFLFSFWSRHCWSFIYFQMQVKIISPVKCHLYQNGQSQSNSKASKKWVISLASQFTNCDLFLMFSLVNYTCILHISFVFWCLLCILYGMWEIVSL